VKSFIILLKKKGVRVVRKGVPVPAAARLCAVYRLLGGMSERGAEFVSSGELGEMLGVGAHNIRKDIGYISNACSGRRGYGVEQLRARIAERFGFDRRHKACVVGLGRLGRALMRDGQHIFSGLEIIAAFDSDVNVVETISSDIPVYPSYDITETVKRMNIDMAILTVPEANAQECADRLINGGVKGIMNFTPERIKTSDGVKVRDIDITGEFRTLSALMFLDGWG
jgi:redox-sensing transcriptional repressor